MSLPKSTGLNGLDTILHNLKQGDNVVWQVDSIGDYLPFVKPYCQYAQKNGLKPVYFRFARHKPLITENSGIEIHNLNPEDGFEKFVKGFHEVIDKYGSEGYYIFDCLSELVADWHSDRMLGNFFLLVCPYIYKAGAIGYFAMLRNKHSFHATRAIMDTPQVFLDVYRHRQKIYIHPIKVEKRYSTTMNLIHVWEKEEFLPVKASVTITEILSKIPWSRLDSASYMLGFWSSTFAEAERIEADLTAGKDVGEKAGEMFKKLLRMAISRDEPVLKLAEKYFCLSDIINIRRRMIGTGLVGGKSVGMLLARAILEKTDKAWTNMMEPHDSFFIGSDVFYTFLVQNNIWWIRDKQKKTPDLLEGAEEVRRKVLDGTFPDYIVEQFVDMLDYFGQSPIIVRSSSLLEDNFGNAFAGKYESVFCANQGTREQRLQEFLSAVRQVYASTMSEDALAYRLQRGLDRQDEQMALLIQRVSGSYHNQYFFPYLAGVGVSYNTFVWKPHLDPKAGMLRLVFGLGTRAVDRIEDDYARIIALDEPLLRPHAGKEEIIKFSQHKVDLLDTKENILKVIGFQELIQEKTDIKLDLIAERDAQTESKMRDLNIELSEFWVLTFKKLITETDFMQRMQKMLKVLEATYKYPVDIEFTANFTEEQNVIINLLQCRPLQTKGIKAKVNIPKAIEPGKIFFQSVGYTMGGNISQSIKRVIYVKPQPYLELPLSGKHDVAKLIGKLNKQISDREAMPAILLGPGRWGTTTPSLGVPVSFSEINNMAVLGEIAYEGGNIMPDLSFGTHFFQDLVESDIFYVALFPYKDNVIFNIDLFKNMRNSLAAIVPEAEKYSEAVKVYEITGNNLQIMCDVISQKVVCFFCDNMDLKNKKT